MCIYSISVRYCPNCNWIRPYIDVPKQHTCTDPCRPESNSQRENHLHMGPLCPSAQFVLEAPQNLIDVVSPSLYKHSCTLDGSGRDCERYECPEHTIHDRKCRVNHRPEPAPAKAFRRSDSARLELAHTGSVSTETLASLNSSLFKKATLPSVREQAGGPSRTNYHGKSGPLANVPGPAPLAMHRVRGQPGEPDRYYKVNCVPRENTNPVARFEDFLGPDKFASGEEPRRRTLSSVFGMGKDKDKKGKDKKGKK